MSLREHEKLARGRNRPYLFGLPAPLPVSVNQWVKETQSLKNPYCFCLQITVLVLAQRVYHVSAHRQNQNLQRRVERFVISSGVVEPQHQHVRNHVTVRANEGDHKFCSKPIF